MMGCGAVAAKNSSDTVAHACAPSARCHAADAVSHSAYDENGRLQEPFSTFTDMPIWECNEYCGCDLSACPNRVVQRGRTVGLDIFKTKEKGWGVRTIDAVPKVSLHLRARASARAG
jgi:hypothetical protein